MLYLLVLWNVIMSPLSLHFTMLLVQDSLYQSTSCIILSLLHLKWCLCLTLFFRGREKGFCFHMAFNNYMWNTVCVLCTLCSSTKGYLFSHGICIFHSALSITDLLLASLPSLYNTWHLLAEAPQHIQCLRALQNASVANLLTMKKNWVRERGNFFSV